MARRFCASGGNFDKHIAEPANGRDRPRVSLRAERRFHLADKSVSDASVSPAAEPPRTWRISCAADSTVASEVATAGERAGTGCAFAVSSCCACASSPRSSNCSRQRCGVSRDSHQSSSVPTSVKLALRRTIRYSRAFFAVAQQGHERSMTMYIRFVRFVQRGDFAMRVVPCARTVHRERHRAVRQHREFAVE
jgi:hypothetical protein